MKRTTILLLSSLFLSPAFAQVDLNNKENQKPSTTLSDTKGERIFNDILNSFSLNADRVIHHFAKDARIEFPYATSLGTAERLNRNEYYEYLKGALPNMPNLQFKHINVYPTTDNAYWAEAHAEVIIPSTGNLYQQKYVMYFVVKDDKISLYREYWDPIAGQKAFGKEKDLKEIFNKNSK